MKTREKRALLFNAQKYLILILGAVSFTGCYQARQTFVLNPEGDGKVHIDAFLPIISLEQKPDLKALHRQMEKGVKKIVTKSSGVEAWSGVSYELTEAGRLHFKGTAYFPDISMLDIRDVFQASMTFLPDKEGRRILLLIQEKKEKRPPGGKALTEEEIREKIKTEKIKFHRARPLLAGFLPDFKLEMLFHLPGKVVSTVNLKQYGEKSCGVSLEGRHILEVIDSLASDETWWRRQAVSSSNVIRDGFMADEEMNERFLGERGPIKAVVSSSVNEQFDYHVEVSAAEKAGREWKKKLGIAD